MDPSQQITEPITATPPHPDRKYRRALLTVAISVFVLAGIGYGAVRLFGNATPKTTPTPTPAPALTSDERSKVSDAHISSTLLQVTELTAERAELGIVTANSLQVTGDLKVGGNGTFGGIVTAANFQGNGAGLTGVDATLLNGQTGTFYQNLGNLTGTLRNDQLPSNVALRDAANTFTAANTFNSALTLGTPLTVANGGTGLGAVSSQGILYGQSGGSLGVAVPAGTGLCLVSGATDVSWGVCGGGTSATLQNAYVNGNSITTSDARDIDIVLADTTTDSNFDLTIADGSTSYVSFARANGTGTTDPAQLLLIDNLDTDRAVAVGIKLQAAAGGLTTAIDASDAEIGTALSVGSNDIQGTTGSISYTNFSLDGANGTLRLSGTGTENYTTPLGTTHTTKLNIANINPGSTYGSIVSMGIPGTANNESYGLAVYDARPNGNHEPSIAVISPDEVNSFGLTWAGSSSFARLKTSNACCGGNTAGVVIQSGSAGAAGTFSGDVYVLSGDSSGLNGTSGNVNLDSGNKTGGGTGTTGAINIGSTYASAVNIGRTGVNLNLASNLFATGAATFKNAADSPSAFQIQTAIGTSLFTVDTTNGRVGINTTSPSERLTVTGGFNVRNADVATKSFRLRTSGANLDLEAGAAKLFLSVWSGADFTGTQYNQMIFDNAGGNIQVERSMEVKNNLVVDASGLNNGTGTNFLRLGSNTSGEGVGSKRTAGGNQYGLDFYTGSVNTFSLSQSGAATFKNASNSATAFQIQDAAAAGLFTVDTTARGAGGGNLVKIGNSTGLDGALTILQLDATTADPTSNLSALNGGLFYNSTTNKVSLIENGQVKIICNTTDLGCGTGTVTLQSAYNNGNAITTSDGRNVLFTLQDSITDSNFLVNLQCTSSCGTNGRFAVQNAGSDILSVSPAGTVQINGYSTSALRVAPTSGSAPVLNVDNLNQQISVGGNANSTALLTVAAKLPQGAPAGTLATTDQAQDIAIQGHYAYVITSTTFVIVDMTRPTGPVAVSTTTIGAGGKVEVSGRYAYLASNSNIYVYDISNPSSPSLVNTVSTGTNYDMALQGRYLYLSAYNGTNYILQVYDLANAAKPLLAGSVSETTFLGTSIAVDGRYVYYLANNKLQIIDVANPAGPINTGSVATTSLVRNVAVEGKYVYYTQNDGGSTHTMTSVNVSNPSSPTAVSTLTLDTLPNGLSIQGRYAYTGTFSSFGSNGIQIVDISNPASMSMVGFATGGNLSKAIVANGRYIWAVAGSGFGAGSVDAYDIGGTYTPQLEAGGIQAGTIEADTYLKVGNSASIARDLNVGNSLQVNGNVGFGGSVLLQNTTDSANAFRVLNAGTGEVIGADTTDSILRLLANNTGHIASFTTNTNNLNSNREGHSTVVVNGYIYVLGGCSGGVAGTTVQYARINSDGSTGVWSTTTGLPQASCNNAATAYNGYIYVSGGTSLAADARDVYYAKVNADGTISAWSTANDVLPSGQDRKAHATVAYNGYLYIIGGANISGVSDEKVHYGRINADGSVGAMSEAGTNWVVASGPGAAATVANGYLYVLGVNSGNKINYGRINANGTIGTAATEDADALSSTLDYAGLVALNGYIYAIGGSNGTSPVATVSYAPLNNDGSTGAWTNDTTVLPSARQTAGIATYNGYIYVTGGWNGSGETNTVYYASGSRVKVGGGLDLIGYSGEGVSDGGSGGSLTAGNTAIVGTLDVTGNAIFKDGLSVLSGVSIKTPNNTTSAFAVLNGSDVPLFGIDTSNSRIYIGNLTGDTTGALLVLDTKTDAGDPTGVEGAMYYNSSMARLRCYYDGKWRFCNDPVGLTWGYNLEEDFMGNSSVSNFYGSNGWQIGASGAGTSVTQVASDIGSRPGQIQLDTGTTATGYAYIYLVSGGNSQSQESITVNGGDEIEFAVNIPTLAVGGGQDYILRLGLCDTFPDCAGAGGDGVYFEYDRATSTNWRYATVNNGIGTKSTSSTAVATGWHRLKIVVNSAATGVDFYVDGTSLGTAITTNIPTARATQPGLGIIKTNGTINSTIKVDYFQYRNSLTTAR